MTSVLVKRGKMKKILVIFTSDPCGFFAKLTEKDKRGGGWFFNCSNGTVGYFFDELCKKSTRIASKNHKNFCALQELLPLINASSPNFLLGATT